MLMHLGYAVIRDVRLASGEIASANVSGLGNRIEGYTNALAVANHLALNAEAGERIRIVADTPEGLNWQGAEVIHDTL